MQGFHATGGAFPGLGSSNFGFRVEFGCRFDFFRTFWYWPAEAGVA
jgi:hypothetical protein